MNRVPIKKALDFRLTPLNFLVSRYFFLLINVIANPPIPKSAMVAGSGTGLGVDGALREKSSNAIFVFTPPP